MNRNIVRAGLVAAVAAAALTPASAFHSWSNYHWASDGLTVPLAINTKLSTPQWETAVAGAVTDWDVSPKLTLLRQQAPAAVEAKKCNPISGQILVCNYAYGQRGWLGIASIWISGGHIVQGTTKLNDSYFNTATYNKPAWRSLVACQEIGHDFGLAHQDENFSNPNLGTCMDYTNAPSGGGTYGPSNEHPNGHDYDWLGQIYNHGDSGGATSSARTRMGGARSILPMIGSAGSGDSPAEWGRAIHFDGEGRPDTFERQLAHGQKLITHVYWAIGEGPKEEGETLAH